MGKAGWRRKSSGGRDLAAKQTVSLKCPRAALFFIFHASHRTRKTFNFEQCLLRASRSFSRARSEITPLGRMIWAAANL